MALETDALVGDLTLIEQSGEGVWRCLCRCGGLRFLSASALTADAPPRCAGSCAPRRHRFVGRWKNTPTWWTWTSMRERCYKKSATNYDKYGARGVRVCVRWRLSFAAFLEDMGERPENHTIDRIDNEKGYFPENCRWATPKQQLANRRPYEPGGGRPPKMITFNGKTLSIRGWAKVVGLSEATLRARLNNGWEPQDALMRPKQRGRAFSPKST